LPGCSPALSVKPRKKLEPNAEGLLGLLHRWRDEAIRAGSSGGSWGGCVKNGAIAARRACQRCRRGPQAAEPGARVLCRRAHAHRQSHEGYPGPAGHGNFKRTLRKAAERLATVHTSKGMPLPPNVFEPDPEVARGLRRIARRLAARFSVSVWKSAPTNKIEFDC
jgi:hypothetical protein